MGVDRRRAPRIACRLPVRLKGLGNPCPGHTKDLSRVGVRLGLSKSELHVAPEADAQTVARALNQRLGPIVVAELHYQLLGALVRKGLRLVRIALPSDDPEHVELGFEFSSVITEEEATFLGVPLPEILEGAEVPESEGEPAAPLCVYLCPTGNPTDVVPLLAPVVTCSDRSMVVRITDPRGLPLRHFGDDVGGRFEAVAAAYGSRTQVLVVHGARPVWFGEADLQSVERPTQRGGFDIELVFDPDGGLPKRLRLWALSEENVRIPSDTSELVIAE